MSNFRPIDRDTGYLLPPSVDEWLPERHLARFVVEVIDGLDLGAFHVTLHGLFGPSLLAMILFEKFGIHQPLNRQSDRYAREGVEISLSTLADQVGHLSGAASVITPWRRDRFRRPRY